MTEASTPLMRQYSAIKKEHPAALLFFRLGDFYEMFFEDAVVAAKELEITLTSRNKEKGIAIPMCGVPSTPPRATSRNWSAADTGWPSANRLKTRAWRKRSCAAR